MILCIDLDDTLAYSAETIVEYAIKFDKDFFKRNTEIKEVKDCTDYYYFANMLNWSTEDVITFFNNCYLEYLPKIIMKEEASNFCKKIKDLGIKIYIVTSRVEKGNDIVLNYTKRMLEDYDISYDELFINVSDKGLFLKDINPDYFVDDSITNCISVKENCPNTNSLLISTKFNKSINNDKINRVDNLDVLYDYILKDFLMKKIVNQ